MDTALRTLVLVAALAALLLVTIGATHGSEPRRPAPPTPEELAWPPRRASGHYEARPTPAETAVRAALRVVGTPYRARGTSPSGGFDCSGLVRWAYGRAGIEVPHSSYALYGTGTSVPRTRMRPGDVLVFSGLGHVGLYIGRGRMVHAPQSGKVVEVVSLAATRYGERLVAARRVAPS